MNKIIHTVVMVLLVAFLLVAGTLLFVPNVIMLAQQEAPEQTTEEERIRDMIHWLQVPPEALFYIPEAKYKLMDIQAEMFQALGVEEVLPYANQVQPGAISHYESGKMPVPPVGNLFFSTRNGMGDTGAECYWRDRLGRICQEIKGMHKQENSYFDRHPETWQTIRNYLLHIIKSDGAYTWVVIPAAEALVAGGDRSDALRERLNDLACANTKLKKTALDQTREMFEACGWPMPAPMPTIADMPVLNSAASELTDSSGDPLPQGVVRRFSCNAVSLPAVDEESLFVSQGNPLKMHRFNLKNETVTTVSVPDETRCMAIDPKRELLATYEEVYDSKLPVLQRRRLMLRNLETGEEIGRLPTPAEVTGLWFDPYHMRLLCKESSGDNSTMSVYDTEQKQLLYRFPTRCRRPHFLPTGKMSIVCASDDGLQLMQEEKHMAPQTFNSLIPVGAVAENPQREQIVALSSEKLISWNAGRLFSDYSSKSDRSNTRLMPLNVAMSPAPSFSAIVLSPEGKLLVVSQRDSAELLVMNLQGQILGRLIGHKGAIKHLINAGNQFISSGDDTTILVWDWEQITNMCRPPNNGAITE